MMTGFRNQLWLLLWKNFTLHKRQKVRIIVELVWPLLLFLILMWVRTRGLKLYIHQCYFDEKAMPSSGILPFLQNTLCTFNNTCHPFLVNDDVRSNIISLNTSVIEEFISDVENISDSNRKFSRDDIHNLHEDLKTLGLFIKKLTDPGLHLSGSFGIKKFLKSPLRVTEQVKMQNISLKPDTVDLLLSSKIRLQGIQKLIDKGYEGFLPYMCHGDGFRHLFRFSNMTKGKKAIQQICKLTDDEISELIVATLKEVNITAFLTELSSFTGKHTGRKLDIEQWEEIMVNGKKTAEQFYSMKSLNTVIVETEHSWKRVKDIVNFSSENDTAKLVQFAVCGRNTSTFFDPSTQGPVRHIEEIKEQMKKDREELGKRKADFVYLYDNTTTPKCNALFSSLEQNEVTRIIWKQIKPFVRGKILFSPNNAVTNRIMSKVNESFHSVLSFRSICSLWLDEYQFMLADFMRNNTQIFQFLKNITSREAILMKFLEKLTFNKSSQRWKNDYLFPTFNNIHWFLDNVLQNWEQWMIQFTKIVEEIQDYLECIDLDRFEGYDTEEDVVHRGLELIGPNKLWAGIVFLNVGHKLDSTLPSYIRYKIRMDANKVDSTKKVEDRLPRPGPRRRPAIDLKYFTYGFAFLQDIIEHSIIMEQTGITSDTGIYLQQFPYPCHIYDQFIMALSRSFPMFMVLSWVYTCAMIIKSIVYEKEKRLKEVMKAMGLSNGVLWLAWFIKSFVSMALSCVLLTLILVCGNVLENSDAGVVFLFLLCYTVATIMKGFLISTLFSRANIAAAAGGLLFFILYLPYPFLVLWEEKLSVNQKAAGCLLSNVAFGFGCSYFAHYEEDGIGIHWSNFASSTIPGDNFSLAHCMGMLILDGVIYGILTWYIEAVFPGQCGVPKPFYFFLTKSYWCGTIHRCDTPDHEDDRPDPLFSSINYEAEPTDLQLGVSIRNLTKIYSNQKVAVDNLSLNFYEGQITSFLGHNGAGKTTTISILTGMFPPTKGTAKIYGADITTDIDIVRRDLGMCPQHNILFDQLTVQEHLWFYSRLKGASEHDVLKETQQMIEDTALVHKKNELSQNLSGGMQRKLSIAIAFVGGSRTVILDEPTAGVDPYARRSIWELLLKYKTGRTVILTTHHMDEADLLGDRIALIANGRLCCCGSSLFLKTCFGNGYYLTLVKATDCLLSDGDSKHSRSLSTDNGSKMSNENVPDEGVADMSTIDSRSDYSDSTAVVDASLSILMPWGGYCSVPKVTTFIQSFVSDAYLVEDVGTELSYLIPPSAQRDGTLEKLFEGLDSKLKDLHIASYGISDTSLEEIFLKVTNEAGNNMKEDESSEGIAGIHSEGIGCRSNTSMSKDHSFYKALGNLKLSDIHKLLTSHKAVRKSYADNTDEIAVHQRLTDGVSNDPSQDPVLPPPVSLTPNNRITGTALLRCQLVALHTRRFHHSRRNYKGLCCEIILPALFVCLALLLTLAIPPMMDEPPLELSPWLYGPPNYVFFSNDAPKNPVTQKYVETFLSFPGIGSRCILQRASNNAACQPLSFNQTLLTPRYNFSIANKIHKCSCDVGTMQCDLLPPDPPKIRISKTDVVLNATGRNISDWIMKTWRKYHKRRYGGFSFGFQDQLSKINFTMLHRAVYSFGSKWINLEQLNDIHSFLSNIEEQIRNIGRSNNIKVWFNNRGWAASVGYMNAVNNLLLRAHLPPGQDPSYYGISVINHPMNFTQDQLQVEVMERSGLSLLHAVCVIFAMSFVTASFVMFLIEDRVTGSKHLQFVSGMKPVTYWIGAYTWDLSNYLIPAGLIILIFVIFNEEAYVSKSNVSGLVLLLFLYGWASIPLIYPASYIFSIPSSAFVALACLNLFIGIVSTLSTYVLELFNDEELLMIAGILRKVFLVFPHYCLGRGLMDMFTNHLTTEMLSRFGIKTSRYPLGWNFLGRNIMCMAIQGAVCFSFTLLIEYKFFIRKRKFDIPSFLPDIEEEDVALERSKILGGHMNKAVLRLENLTKIYKRGQHPAVNHLCVAVQPGECFGLLGVNGAGKTTTFKMLTGNTSITGGNAYISGHSIKTEIDKARQSIGYCPQFDALDPLLTGWEHLEFYARLRGIPEKYISKVASWGIQKLGLSAYASHCSGTYSGGNKRKLSTAIALIGNPSVIFLDEPTTGMDPKARRFLWNCIIDIVKEGHSVILTSHSMEECEALCTRLAIMVNGQFRCLGSIQHLKNKYGAGYTVTLRVGGGARGMQEVATHMEKTFASSAVLQEQHLNQMEYQLAPSLSLSYVFKELKLAREHLQIEDYSVCQTTLDQVFISFAKMQADVSEELPSTTLQNLFKNSMTANKRKKAGSKAGTPQTGDIELLVQNSSHPVPAELV